MRDNTKTQVLAIAVLGVCLCVFFVFDHATSSLERSQVTVVGKTYVPSRTEIVSDVDAEGKPVLSTVEHPERWILIVASDGRAISVDVPAVKWTAVSEGDNVTLVTRRGGVSGAELSQFAD